MVVDVSSVAPPGARPLLVTGEWAKVLFARFCGWLSALSRVSAGHSGLGRLRLAHRVARP